jgi:hypothetical protein
MPPKPHEKPKPHKPVAKLAELDTFGQNDMAAGALAADDGEPEPGPNQSRAYYHGWRARMMARQKIPTSEEQVQLDREFLMRLAKLNADAELAQARAAAAQPAAQGPSPEEEPA